MYNYHVRKQPDRIEMDFYPVPAFFMGQPSLGSAGTAMASFIPLVLTEEEAWHVILYVRSFGK